MGSISEDYSDTKVLIFTEHRDTLDFVTGRLEAKGFGGKVAQIHGSMKYNEREEQVERSSVTRMGRNILWQPMQLGKESISNSVG